MGNIQLLTDISSISLSSIIISSGVAVFIYFDTMSPLRKLNTLDSFDSES
ncbi:MAG: hypothetical protein ACPKPY_00365 [Nitrososphaeraceae archaeon]